MYVLTCDGEHGLDALPADGVVDHAEVLPGVVHLGLLDDQRPADLLHALVQLHQLLVVVALHELVPSTEREKYIRWSSEVGLKPIWHKYCCGTVAFFYAVEFSRESTD